MQWEICMYLSSTLKHTAAGGQLLSPGDNGVHCPLTTTHPNLDFCSDGCSSRQLTLNVVIVVRFSRNSLHFRSSLYQFYLEMHDFTLILEKFN